MQNLGRNIRREEAGFTLIELSIVIVLIGIIAGVGAMLILQGVNAYISQDVRADLTSQGRLAIERMAREIRTIRQASEMGTAVIGTISGNPTSSLIFADLTGTSITYSLSGTTLNRTVGAGVFALAEGVAALEFRHYDTTGALTTTPASVWQVQIDLALTKKGESQSFKIRVHPRNFP